MRRGLIILSALLALSVSRSAAATVIVTYAFDDTNSVLSITSPTVVSIPPQGTLEGSILVSYSSNAAGEIIDGPATLQMFDLSSNLNVSTVLFGSAITLTGPASASLQDPVDGMLSGNQLTFGGAMGSFHAFGSLTCGGVICATAGFTPGVPQDFDGVGSVPLPTMTVASIHGTLTGLTFDVGNVPIVASLAFDAPEVARETVPEPAAWMLLGAAAALVALPRHRRSRAAA